MDPLLKQRLVGAAVLVGLAVIFVPMVLDGPVERVEPAAPAGVPLALPELPERQAEPEPSAAVPTVQPAAAERPRPAAPRPAVEATPRTQPPAGAGWAVQLGSFSSGENAEALARRVREQGFDAFVQEVSTASGMMYRVRIGPLADRGAAETLGARVQRQTGERTVVVPHP